MELFSIRIQRTFQLVSTLYKRPTVLNCAFIVVLGINERSTIMSMFLISMKQNYISLLPWDKPHILQVIFLTLFRLIV